jgi:transposase
MHEVQPPAGMLPVRGLRFKANKQISQAVVEAMNGNAKLAIRKARGFRSYATLRIALFHQLGALPEPHFSTHRFW